MPDTLRAQQFALSRHLRDPAANPPPPGIEDRRLAIYRELFYNNIEGLLSANFPVIRKTLGDERWHALIHGFHADHRSHTPLFPELGREFIRYVETRADAAADLPPWLLELAHYEWIELALQIADDEVPRHDPRGDLLAGMPVLSPFVRALAYQWPVARIGPDFQPDTPPAAPTLILVRRDASQYVRFADISPLVYRLLELLGQGDATGEATLRRLAAEADAEDIEDFLHQGTAMLERMREEGTVLGTRPAPTLP
jgi:hypothetical protein